MGSRVVRPDTDTLSISDGDWILVKKRLNHGEQQAAFEHRFVSDSSGQRVNLALAGMENITAYLLDWSLTGLDGQLLVIKGQPLDVVEGHLNRIEPESVVEIRDAIDAHVRAQAVARAEEKKLRTGGSADARISPLPSAVAGASSGSVN